MSYTVKRLTVGALDTNCYILKDSEKASAVVIDPGGDAALIKNALCEAGAFPSLILLTHGHFDHILALDEVRNENTIVCIHEKDADGLLRSRIVSPEQLGYNPWPFKKADLLFKADGRFEAGGFVFEVLQTPGHTEGSVCYEFGSLLFTGDTLFCGSIGRTDLAGGSETEMGASLARLRDLPGDRRVFPGHGCETTLAAERLRNPYFRRLSSL